MILGNRQRSTVARARHSVRGWACQHGASERLHSDPGATRDMMSSALLACRGDIRLRNTKLQPCWKSQGCNSPLVLHQG